LLCVLLSWRPTKSTAKSLIIVCGRQAATKQLSSDPKAALNKEVSMKYVCGICGFVYDPQLGDMDNDIEPGTAFADLPDDWQCPVCCSDKSEFAPLKN
jgi:rubredoxin